MGSVSVPLFDSADTKPQQSEGAEVTDMRPTIRGTGYSSQTRHSTQDGRQLWWQFQELAYTCLTGTSRPMKRCHFLYQGQPEEDSGGRAPTTLSTWIPPPFSKLLKTQAHHEQIPPLQTGCKCCSQALLRPVHTLRSGKRLQSRSSDYIRG